MKKKRIIPVLLLNNGWVVQSKLFSQYRNLGNPTASVERLSNWASDELIYLDISKGNNYNMGRTDLIDPNRDNIVDIIKDISKVAFMPLTFGGKISNISDIEIRLRSGADKISINTIAIEKPSFINEAAQIFGSQCIVVSIDVKKIDNKYYVIKKNGTIFEKYTPHEWANLVQDYGAGEIFLNSIDCDGMKNGFDIDMINYVTKNINIPVIACGGAGEWQHFLDVFQQTNVDAVAAANIFQHVDQSVYLAKKYLFENKINVREPKLLSTKKI